MTHAKYIITGRTERSCFSIGVASAQRALEEVEDYQARGLLITVSDTRGDLRSQTDLDLEMITEGPIEDGDALYLATR